MGTLRSAIPHHQQKIMTSVLLYCQLVTYQLNLHLKIVTPQQDPVLSTIMLKTLNAINNLKYAFMKRKTSAMMVMLMIVLLLWKNVSPTPIILPHLVTIT